MGASLTDHEARVLGCLMEKSMSTPEYYPLSLNALANACNQKSNRDPVVDWDDQTVESAAAALVEKGLAHRSTVGRVPKYEETFTRQHSMVAAEAAVLCILLLRGPQTPGAIRSRCGRMATIEDLTVLQEVLDRLGEWGYVHRLERIAGHKESRYTHLLCGLPGDEATPVETIRQRDAVGNGDDRLAHLESEVQRLQDKLEGLMDAFESFRQQFD